MLLADGSLQEDIWGADWYPSTQEVTYESFINIRPRQNNRSMEIVEESRYLIEWTALDMEIDTAAELLDLQRLMTHWLSNWDSVWSNVAQRTQLTQIAGTWSERVLNMSGLLSAPKNIVKVKKLTERSIQGCRFAYDCGTLEIMTPLFEHETRKHSSDFGFT